MKCPFCQQELVREGSDNYWCKRCNLERVNPALYGSQKLWQELIRTRKALDVATGFIKGISQTAINDCDNQYVVLGNFKKFAQDTLEQITALEQKDK